jgi:predicted benzoate:H+ symporter BenE
MPITNPTKPLARQTRAQTFGPQVLFGVTVAAAFAVLAGAVTVLPGALLAPLASTVLLVMAAAAALAGWLREGEVNAARVTYWDAAGALTFVGIGAAALVDPEQLARVFDAPSHEK